MDLEAVYDIRKQMQVMLLVHEVVHISLGERVDLDLDLQ